VPQSFRDQHRALIQDIARAADQFSEQRIDYAVLNTAGRRSRALQYLSSREKMMRVR
jgi:hypothetical protein